MKEKWVSSEFYEIQVSEALPNLPPCASFWRRLWLPKPIEKFLCVVWIRFECVKHSPRSWKDSALWFMTVRPIKQSLFDKVSTPHSSRSLDAASLNSECRISTQSLKKSFVRLLRRPKKTFSRPLIENPLNRSFVNVLEMRKHMRIMILRLK